MLANENEEIVLTIIAGLRKLRSLDRLLDRSIGPAIARPSGEKFTNLSKISERLLPSPRICSITKEQFNKNSGSTRVDSSGGDVYNYDKQLVLPKVFKSYNVHVVFTLF